MNIDDFGYHYYDADDGGARTFNMRRLLWTADGWPVAGDHLALPADKAGHQLGKQATRPCRSRRGGDWGLWR